MRFREIVVSVLASALVVACASASPGADPDDPIGDHAFDRVASEQAAVSLIGLPEQDVREGPATRIVRRGAEQYPATLDLQPGRRNVELDDDGSGTYVVTRVVVEVPDGEDPLVVETTE